MVRVRSAALQRPPSDDVGHGELELRSLDREIGEPCVWCGWSAAQRRPSSDDVGHALRLSLLAGYVEQDAAQILERYRFAEEVIHAGFLELTLIGECVECSDGDDWNVHANVADFADAKGAGGGHAI